MLLGGWPCSPGTIDAVTASKNREACHSAWVTNQTARDEVARKPTRKHDSSQPMLSETPKKRDPALHHDPPNISHGSTKIGPKEAAPLPFGRCFGLLGDPRKAKQLLGRESLFFKGP